MNNQAQHLNQSGYSDDLNKNEVDYETPEPLIKGPDKFCWCTSIENGVMIIGVLEVIAAVLQVVNVMYSIRVSLGMFLFFNVPLLTAWGLRYHNMNLNRVVTAYQWNSVFMSFYSLRLVTFMILGFVFLVIASNHAGPVDFFCDRYFTIDDGKDHNEDIEECRNDLRILGWIVYFPAIIFQIHCIMVLNQHRKTGENQVMIEAGIIGKEDDI